MTTAFRVFPNLYQDSVSPMVALGYAMFGATCFILARGQPDAPAQT